MPDYWTIEVDGEADTVFLDMLRCIPSGVEGYTVSITIGGRTVYGQCRDVHDGVLVLMETDDTFENPVDKRPIPLASIDTIHVY